MKESILIIDFGSQVTKLIARRIREIGVFSQIIPFNEIKKDCVDLNSIKGIIFSGGPKSVKKKIHQKLKALFTNLEFQY